MDKATLHQLYDSPGTQTFYPREDRANWGTWEKREKERRKTDNQSCKSASHYVIQFTFRGTETNETLALVKEYSDPVTYPLWSEVLPLGNNTVTGDYILNGSELRRKEDVKKHCVFSWWWMCVLELFALFWSWLIQSHIKWIGTLLMVFEFRAFALLGCFSGWGEWDWLVGLINKVSYYIDETWKITLMSDCDFPSGRPRSDMVLWDLKSTCTRTIFRC